MGLTKRMGARGASLALSVAMGWLSVGCDEKQAAPPSEPSAASAVPSAPPPPPLPWFVGTWSGEYEAKHFLIEMEAKDGAVLHWKRDDGGTYSGKGELELSIDEEGVVFGVLTGPLGEFTATGTLEEELLSVQLMPRPGTQVTSALLMGKREGEGFKGTLRASTGDSLTVRQAEVSLSKLGSELKHQPGQVEEAAPTPDAGAGEAGAAPSGAEAGAAPAPSAAPPAGSGASPTP
ncbi:MAG: hypothetical protein KF915_19480 [Polyangiaceae bacterium]|nr:hypothetical protein [Polyangiaceae bacterium]